MVINITFLHQNQPKWGHSTENPQNLAIRWYNSLNRCIWLTVWPTDVWLKFRQHNNHVSVFVKIRKILSHKVENAITMVVVVFWSTEINFWPIPTHEGSIPVSDIILVHLQGSQVRPDVKKPVSVKSLITRDHARTHIYELSQGSLGTQFALKTTLEGVISTRNGRVASRVSHRQS